MGRKLNSWGLRAVVEKSKKIHARRPPPNMRQVWGPEPEIGPGLAARLVTSPAPGIFRPPGQAALHLEHPPGGVVFGSRAAPETLVAALSPNGGIRNLRAWGQKILRGAVQGLAWLGLGWLAGWLASLGLAWLAGEPPWGGQANFSTSGGTRLF